MNYDITEIRAQLERSYGHMPRRELMSIIESNKEAYNDYKLSLELLGYKIVYLSRLAKAKAFSDLNVKDIREKEPEKGPNSSKLNIRKRK